MKRIIAAATALLAGVMAWAASPQPVIVWGLASTADDKGSDAVVRAFEEEHPEYKIYLMGMGAGGMNPQKLMTAIVGNAAPDVIKQDRFSISDWASRGAFLSLNNLIQRDRTQTDCPRPEDYYTAPWQEATYDGQLYGIPIGSDVRVLYWNKDIFHKNADKLRAAGLDPDQPPKTWSELDKYDVTLTEKDKDGSIKAVGGMPNFGNTWLYMYSIQNGGSFVSADGRRATFDTPENLQALNFMFEGYKHLGTRDQTRRFEQGFQTEENDPFLKDQVAIEVTGEWVLEGYNRYRPNLNFGAALAPVPDDRFNQVGRFKDVSKYSTWTGGFAYAIPKGGKNVEGAWAFIKFATSLKGRLIEMAAQSDLARSKGRRYIPRIWALKSAAQESAKIYCSGDDAFSKAFRTHIAAMDYSACRGQTFAAQAVWDAQQRAFEQTLNEEKSPEQALKDADKDVQKILDEYWGATEKPIADLRIPVAISAAGAFIFLAWFIWWVRKGVKSRVGAQEALAGYGFISPWIFGFLVFTAGPMLASFFISFTVYNVLSPPRFVGLTNYGHLLSDDLPLIAKSYSNAAYLAFLGIPVGNALGLCVAMLLNTGIKGMRVYRTLFYMPAVIPVVISTILWIVLMNANPSTGLVNAAWHATLEPWFGAKPPGWMGSPEWAKPSLILQGLWGVGSGMMLWLAGLKSVPSSLYEAASIDGASPWKQFCRITIPQLTPLIYFNLIMSIIAVMQTFDNIYVIINQPGLGPGDSLMMPVVKLFQEGFMYFRMGYASALAWLLFLVLLLITGLNVWLGKYWVHSEVKN